jgi:hypothetical protein
MAITVDGYIENIAWVLLWVGMWSLIDMFVHNYLKTYKVWSYLLLFITGTLMMFLI